VMHGMRLPIVCTLASVPTWVVARVPVVVRIPT